MFIGTALTGVESRKETDFVMSPTRFAFAPGFI
jgi:hypothetical protein